MPSVVDALFPVLVLIGAGLVLKRLAFPAMAFWPELERLVYMVLFPALLVHDLALADLDGAAFRGLLLASSIGIAAMTLASFVAARVLGLAGPGFTSLFQGATRCNGFVALAAAHALRGEAGLSTMAVVITCMVPAVNAASVVLLAVAGGGRGGLAKMLGQVATNPLILGCLGGIALNHLGIGLHPVVARTLSVLGNAALPLGLLALGAGLDFARIGSARLAVFGGALAKCFAFPLLMLGLARLVGLDARSTWGLVLFATMPTAPSAYILARQLGGDAALVGGITTLSTVVAVVSVPLMLGWLL